MRDLGTRREHPELKALVVEASQALARLDAARLEELAVSCQALNRELAGSGREERARLAREARDAAGEMAVFGRVLEVTRNNLQVMNRLRELRMGCAEYNEPEAPRWARGGSGHGDN